MRKQNENRTQTSISVPKLLKLRIRKYAEVSSNRKGHESDEIVLERIISFYEKNNPTNREPKNVYDKPD